jgi:regulation of enolase protein 1 (concanavalin A-like superfamily)
METGIWRNEPAHWEKSGDMLTVTTSNETDFWNNTFYGFKHDNGHFLAHRVSGDFSAEMEFSGSYKALYDQAGIMLWVDGENWLKAGIEFTDNMLHFSVVVTRDDQSDWSVTPLPGPSDAPVTLRLTRHAEALRVQVFRNDSWQLVRLAFLRMPEGVDVGPMCCSPVSHGLEVKFNRFEVGAAIGRELHT